MPIYTNVQIPAHRSPLLFAAHESSNAIDSRETDWFLPIPNEKNQINNKKVLIH